MGTVLALALFVAIVIAGLLSWIGKSTNRITRSVRTLVSFQMGLLALTVAAIFWLPVLQASLRYSAADKDDYWAKCAAAEEMAVAWARSGGKPKYEEWMLTAKGDCAMANLLRD